jgi:hypothetical protein
MDIQEQRFRREHVGAWRASGLSQRHYCEKHNLRLNSLAYWIKRERQIRAESGLQVVPVRVVAAVDQPIRLCGPGAWLLEIPAGASMLWLGDLLRALP